MQISGYTYIHIHRGKYIYTLVKLFTKGQTLFTGKDENESVVSIYKRSNICMQLGGILCRPRGETQYSRLGDEGD